MSHDIVQEHELDLCPKCDEGELEPVRGGDNWFVSRCKTCNRTFRFDAIWERRREYE